jgi:tRNA (guanine37-N1)-methyltransferase
LLEGALNDARSSAEESFADGLLDWPHYTRPVEFAGIAVPQVLQGGDHERIRRWRLREALGRTWRRRPDLLLARRASSAEEIELLNEFLQERQTEP